MTYTYALLEVSKETYIEIETKLRKVEYDHAIVDDVIDMHGIGLKIEDPKIKEHNWKFYFQMNGTFCRDCNARLGDGRKECK